MGQKKKFVESWLYHIQTLGESEEYCSDGSISDMFPMLFWFMLTLIMLLLKHAQWLNVFDNALQKEAINILIIDLQFSCFYNKLSYSFFVVYTK